MQNHFDAVLGGDVTIRHWPIQVAGQVIVKELRANEVALHSAECAPLPELAQLRLEAAANIFAPLLSYR